MAFVGAVLELWGQGPHVECGFFHACSEADALHRIEHVVQQKLNVVAVEVSSRRAIKQQAGKDLVASKA